MTSPYLLQHKRTYEEVTALRDSQPDLKFFGDGLQQALHNHICMASFIRQQTRRIIAGMKWRGSGKLALDELNTRWADDLSWVREARKAHSKAILNREAYKQMINEREIARSLRLLGEEE